MDPCNVAALFVFSLAVILVYPRPGHAYSIYESGDGTVHRLDVTQDVCLADTNNLNHLQHLIVAKLFQYPKKRSLVQFEDLQESCCIVVWAKMYLYLAYAHIASWHDRAQAPDIMRPIQVYQVRNAWNETQATRDNRLSGVAWSAPYLKLGEDTYNTALDTVEIYPRRPASYYEFDVTEAVISWQNLDQANNGLLIMATNEDIDGRGIRFYSNANADNHAFINVMCK